MQLPGGLWHNEKLYRDFTFRPLTGAVELAVSEAFYYAITIPDAVTEMLYHTIAHIGSKEPDREMIDALSAGDRQFLTACLAGYLGNDEAWFTVKCRHCEERFDFSLRFSELPVKAAGPSYPFCKPALESGTFTWRVPDGGDQKAVAGLSSDEEACIALLNRCVVNKKNDPEIDIKKLTKHEISLVEESMEAQAPQVANRIQVSCINCFKPNEFEVDPINHLNTSFQRLLDDVHRIASVYNWSEAEILSLPRQRRMRYLELIDRNRGMSN